MEVGQAEPTKNNMRKRGLKNQRHNHLRIQEFYKSTKLKAKIHVERSRC